MIFIKYIKNSIYRNTFVVGIVLMWITLRMTAYIDYMADSRIGVQLYDPIIALLPPPTNYSIPIFLLTYGVIITMICYGFFYKPIIWIQYTYGIIFINIIRSIFIWNIPLEPPTGIILLRDFFIEASTPNGLPAAKDLFFSGHAASTLLAALLITHPILRKITLIATFVMAFLILNQRVHYSIDILGGWLVAYWCQQLVQYVLLIWMPKIDILEV